ncbi:uncharacterized protein LOC143856674 [Tasmannia lanceolata]|uniref:uncharacterized protein LOC143856674 n=1 Tax=Tasmannia lanceolata TaxID=3420 RepID=UPI0040647D35
MVPDEDTKWDKFEHGLAMYIQKGIVGSNAPKMFTELVNLWTVPKSTLPVASYVYVLFDYGATHSFVSSSVATLHSFPSVPIDHDLCVSTPVGKDLMTDRISKTCPIRIGDKELLADLILLELYDFDVILGMDLATTSLCLGGLQGCEAFLASVVDVNHSDVKIEDISLVRDFVDVFREDLPGLPPDRDVECTVDLAPGTTPISKACIVWHQWK